MQSAGDEEQKFYVVINDEEQYSIWPADRKIPLGWRTVGQADTREACLVYVKQTWTDMRPLSVRDK